MSHTARVLHAIRTRPAEALDIASATGLTHREVRYALRRLVRRHRALCEGGGRYRAIAGAIPAAIPATRHAAVPQGAADDTDAPAAGPPRSAPGAPAMIGGRASTLAHGDGLTLADAAARLQRIWLRLPPLPGHLADALADPLAGADADCSAAPREARP